MNPIRRVVTMLQAMAAKITAEGEKEKELFEKFMCYCKNGAAGLEKSIEDAEVKIPELESEINATAGEVIQLTADVKAHKADREAAKVAMEKATAVREKEAAEYAKATADDKTNLAAMTKAIAALEKGVGTTTTRYYTSFLQTTAADVLKRFVVNADQLDDSSRSILTSFLAQSSGDEGAYAPSSGEVIGILKQMVDTLNAELAEAEAAEKKAIEEYEALMAAKKKEIDALTKMIEEKLARIGEAGVEVVNMANDLEETKESLEEDKKFLADLKTSCATKEKEWEERCKVRSEELIALSDTIKILNDDDALELFKKTLPTPAALLQIAVTSQEVTRRVQQILRNSKRHDYRLDLISLALHGKKVSFEKIIGMIDDMVALLEKEQGDDDSKKAECEASLDENEDKLKELEHTIGDLEKAIADAEEAISTLTEEIAALVQGIKDLDKQVAEATENRKEEHEEYVETMASDTAAKELLEIAKNRLNKFYNPKLYKPAPKKVLTAEEAIYSNLGGKLTTAAPGGIADTGVTALSQEKPAPPPETWDAYAKKTEEGNGVIAMIDLLIKDLTKEMTELEFGEKDAQSDYAKMMVEAKEKRAADSKVITEKEGTKADLEVKLQSDKEAKESAAAEAMATEKTIMDLHAECDWLISNFEIRKEARAGEIDSLKKAKAVLSGADYSLMQTHARKHLRQVRRL